MMRLIGNLENLSMKEYAELLQRSSRFFSQANKVYKAYKEVNVLANVLNESSKDTKNNPDKQGKRGETQEKIIEVAESYLHAQAFFVVATTGDLWFSEIFPEDYSQTTQRQWRVLQGITEVAQTITAKYMSKVLNDNEVKLSALDCCEVLNVAFSWVNRNSEIVSEATSIPQPIVGRVGSLCSKLFTVVQACNNIYTTWNSTQWDSVTRDEESDSFSSNEVTFSKKILHNAAIVITLSGDIFVNDIMNYDNEVDKFASKVGLEICKDIVLNGGNVDLSSTIPTALKAFITNSP